MNLASLHSLSLIIPKRDTLIPDSTVPVSWDFNLKNPRWTERKDKSKQSELRVFSRYEVSFNRAAERGSTFFIFCLQVLVYLCLVYLCLCLCHFCYCLTLWFIFSVSFSCRFEIQVISCFISCSSRFLLLFFSLHFQSPAPPLFVSPVSPLVVMLHVVPAGFFFSLCRGFVGLFLPWYLSSTNWSRSACRVCVLVPVRTDPRPSYRSLHEEEPWHRGYWGVAARPENSRFPVSVRPLGSSPSQRPGDSHSWPAATPRGFCPSAY